MIKQNYTVRENRNRARIWLEGKRLEGAGFEAGSIFEIERLTKNKLRLSLIPLGAEDIALRKVSGKPGRPIIDLTGATIAPFETGDDVSIEYATNQITIKRV